MITGGPERSYTVELFQPGVDISADIARMHFELRRWQVASGQNTFSNILDSQADLGDIEKYYLEPGGHFFIAKDSDRTKLGFVGLRHNGEGQGVLKRLAVMQEHHGKGIGSLLVPTLVGWARENDFKRISLQTGEKEKARSIYLRNGFREVGRLVRNRDYLMEQDLVDTSEN